MESIGFTNVAHECFVFWPHTPLAIVPETMDTLQTPGFTNVFLDLCYQILGETSVLPMFSMVLRILDSHSSRVMIPDTMGSFGQCL